MARAKAKTRSGSKDGKGDAIALLKADHRQVEEWFEQFEKARDEGRKQDLAARICKALKVHTTIEEEIFYPAFLDATEDKDLHHEAEIEHDGAKKLIAEIEGSEAGAELFDAQLKVLGEYVKHHIKEEYRSIFPVAKKSGVDLDEMGERLQARKKELKADLAQRH